MLTKNLKEELEFIVEMKPSAKNLPSDLQRALLTWLRPGFYSIQRKPGGYGSIRSQNSGFKQSVKYFGPRWQQLSDKEILYGIWNNEAGDYYAYSFRDGSIWVANHETSKLEKVGPYKNWVRYKYKEYQNFLRDKKRK